MRIFFICFLAIAPAYLFSQAQTHNWFFGQGVGMDFSGGDPIGFDGGQVYSNPQGQMEYLYSEGVAVISDDLGDLLFYSNGEKVWDRNHEIMPNGGDLMGMYSSTSAAFIVPQPNSDSLFFLFTTDGLERQLGNGLRYNKIGMCRNEGKGDVLPDAKNILLLDTVSEKLAATYHANGTDVWLVAHKYFSDEFYSFRIGEAGIIDTVISQVGSVHVGNPNIYGGCAAAIGQMKISSDGSRLALAVSNVQPARAELFDFNVSTGEVSSLIGLQTYGELESNEFIYGVEFSPDNSKLYLNGTSGLLQFNLGVGNDSVSINASKQMIPMSYTCSMSNLQLAPDEKIYVGRCSTTVAVIHEPNLAGLDCNVQEHAVTFGSNWPRGNFPSFIAGLTYQNRKPECSVVTNSPETEHREWKFFPNPAKSILHFSIESNAFDSYSIEISDISGRTVFVKTFTDVSMQSIDLSGFTSGIYLIKVIRPDSRVWSERIIVE